MPLTKRIAELVPDFFESRSHLVEEAVRHQHRCESLDLAGCAPIDELKDTLSGWFATGKFIALSLTGLDFRSGHVQRSDATQQVPHPEIGHLPYPLFGHI
jgi:hypothetical protein